MNDLDPTLAQFNIIELEDRLEFAELCDDNCGCNTGSNNTNCGSGGGGGGSIGIEPNLVSY